MISVSILGSSLLRKTLDQMKLGQVRGPSRRAKKNGWEVKSALPASCGGTVMEGHTALVGGRIPHAVYAEYAPCSSRPELTFSGSRLSSKKQTPSLICC